MSYETYRRRMRETADAVAKSMEQIIETESRGQGRWRTKFVRDVATWFPRQRSGIFSTRSHMLRSAYELLSGKPWSTDIQRACAILDIALGVNYGVNIVVDHKLKSAPVSADNQVIAIPSLQAIGSRAIEQLQDDRIREVLRDTYDDIILDAMYGQVIDVNAAGKIDDPHFHSERLRFLNAEFYQYAARIGAQVARSDECNSSLFTQFAEHYGIAMQHINDICDFVRIPARRSTAAKDADDAFMDIINKRHTLPILSLRERGSPEVLQMIEQAPVDGLTDDQKDSIVREFVKSGAFGFSRRNGAGMMNNAKSLLEKVIFPSTPASEAAYKGLQSMTHIASKNRFYRELEKYS